MIHVERGVSAFHDATSSSNSNATGIQSLVQDPLRTSIPRAPYGSSYDPFTSPVGPSTSGPVPVTPLEDPRERSARVKLTAARFAGRGAGVGGGARGPLGPTSLESGG